MIYLWRALYGLPPLVAGLILIVYRGRLMYANAKGLSGPKLSRSEIISLVTIGLWGALHIAIVHWQLWPDLDH